MEGIAKKKLLPHEKIAYRYFIRLSDRKKEAADAYQVLNQGEIAEIKRIERDNILYSAWLGALGVLLLYTPSYLFHDFFYSIVLQIPVPFTEISIPLPLVFTIYGVFTAILEILAIMFVNIRSVHQIAFVCGFPNPKDPRYEEHLNALFEVGLEKPSKDLLKLGIDPYAGVSRFYLFLYTTLITLKATLSNALIKILLGRILGRFALRYAIDLISVPIFAFWNGYGASIVVREAKLRILAPGVISAFTYYIFLKHKEDAQFKAVLYEALQFVAVAKRNFHPNHFLLAEEIIQVFGLEIEKQKEVKADELLQKINALDTEAKESFMKLLVLGVIIDGSFSVREQKVIALLNERKVLSVDSKKVKIWAKDFERGAGLQEMFDQKLFVDRESAIS